MNISDFNIQEGTIGTIKESRKDLKKLLDTKEFSEEDYEYQLQEISKYDENLLCAWAERSEWEDGGFLDHAGLLIYKENGEVVEFLGYC